MATPTKSQANADAQAALDEIIDAANQVFIDGADAAIANAIELGKFRITLNSIQHMSINDIVDYYSDLGYAISAPPCFIGQPALLFGPFWVAYWNNKKICNCKNPCKISISWK